MLHKRIEGKTKIVIPDPNNPLVVDGTHKDVVTWDDIHSEPMEGKGAWCNLTNESISLLLRVMGEPVAFLHLTSRNTYRAINCDMIRLEVIVRAEVDVKSSYLKRNPDAVVGKPFPEPVVEFYLKTDGPEWEGIPLPTADPFITRYDATGIWVHHPKLPVTPGGERFISAAELHWDTSPYGAWPFSKIEEMSLRSFKIVRSCFAVEGLKLKDWKEEYGYGSHGELLHADTYDNDVWRIEDEITGREYSKQVVRNRGREGIEDSKRDYAFITEVTSRMRHRTMSK